MSHSEPLEVVHVHYDELTGEHVVTAKDDEFYYQRTYTMGYVPSVGERVPICGLWSIVYGALS